MANDNLEIAPVNMGQSMSVAAQMVLGLTTAFIDPEEPEEQKVAKTYACLSFFFYQLCMPAKHKDKMIAILELIVAEMKERA
jgi:hypothetical protein